MTGRRRPGPFGAGREGGAGFGEPMVTGAGASASALGGSVTGARPGATGSVTVPTSERDATVPAPTRPEASAEVPAPTRPEASAEAPAPPRPEASAEVPIPTPPEASAEAPTAPRRGPRRARLTLRHVDPWSVLKVAFLFSLAMLIVVIVAVALLYLVLDTLGVFTSIDKALRDLTTSTDPTSVTDIVSFPRVLGGAAVLGAINVLLFTGLATLGAFLYNLCASIGGGIDLTLSERN